VTVRVSIIALLVSIAAAGMSYGQTNAGMQGSALGAAGMVWGGDHLSLEITADGAKLDFDCASGTITHPLSIDAQGKFHSRGTFTSERPGPVMRDSPGAAQATYTGTIQGDTMHLVVSSGNQQPYGEYVLTRGRPGRVMKCK
jgi:hypothetical protein